MNRTCWRILKNEEEHAVAMNRLIELASISLQPGTDDFDEFELLSLLIEHYEGQVYPMDKPEPIEAIKFRMDQLGLTQADMKQYIGSGSKVSEVLNRKRPLSLSMIRRIHDGLGIPADILIQDMSAIEWNLVDAEEEATLTSIICQYDPFDAMPDFSNHAAQRYVSSALLRSSRNNDRCEERHESILDGFSLVFDRSSSLTAANNLNDGMTSNGNYALVS